MISQNMHCFIIKNEETQLSLFMYSLNALLAKFTNCKI